LESVVDSELLQGQGRFQLRTGTLLVIPVRLEHAIDQDSFHPAIFRVVLQPLHRPKLGGDAGVLIALCPQPCDFSLGLIELSHQLGDAPLLDLDLGPFGLARASLTSREFQLQA